MYLPIVQILVNQPIYKKTDKKCLCRRTFLFSKLFKTLIVMVYSLRIIISEQELKL